MALSGCSGPVRVRKSLFRCLALCLMGVISATPNAYFSARKGLRERVACSLDPESLWASGESGFGAVL
ncbi:hypothetical protein GW7_02879 [Heterocephalus glaber]|uniref:Uncharacterized protein n=1 Tax=Heterocephalus glaber TaxID=10181 RepID=G5AXG1_HETGA|nr:hypothetical protein GW7_02879 [Heterocephalus glaber]